MIDACPPLPLKKTQVEKIWLENLDPDPSPGKTLAYKDVTGLFITWSLCLRNHLAGSTLACCIVCPCQSGDHVFHPGNFSELEGWKQLLDHGARSGGVLLPPLWCKLSKSSFAVPELAVVNRKSFHWLYRYTQRHRHAHKLCGETAASALTLMMVYLF